MKTVRQLFVRQRASNGVVTSTQQRTLFISRLGEKARDKELEPYSAGVHDGIGNGQNQLSQTASRRLGRVALVIGGTGVAGKHVCQALAERHVQTFSLSRRGGVTEAQHSELSYLDEVNWIEGDVSDATVWEELQPLLKNVNEVHICLPRTGSGAMLAAESIRRLREGSAHPQHITLLSVPSESTLGDSLVADWEDAERLLQHHYPKDYRVFKPDLIHDTTPSFFGTMKNWMLRVLHFKLMRDEQPNKESSYAVYASLNRYHETKQSRYFAPSTHAGLIAQAAMEEQIADLNGGEIRRLGTYELQVLPFRKLNDKVIVNLKSIYISPMSPV